MELRRVSKKTAFRIITAAGTILAFLLLCASESFLSRDEFFGVSKVWAGEESSSEKEPDYTRELAERSQTFDPEDARLIVSEDLKIQEEKTHTVMIYMIGSNLESRLGNATKDLEEMRQAGLTFKNVNVLVYTGGSRRWISDVPCDKNCVLDLSKDTKERIVARTEVNANMGAAETLVSFVNFCTQYYPAEHNSLIFWDHGGGPLWGYGSDELFRSDSLLLEEQKAAMEQTVFAKDKKLDLVGFDACLMGSIESMAIWQNYAEIYIGSEELEPGDGWDYHFLRAFEQSENPKETALAITSGYFDYYSRIRTDTYNPDVTLSSIDLSKADEICEAVNRFAACMVRDYKGGAYSSVMQRRALAKGFGLYENSKGYISYYYDIVDLGDLAARFADAYPEEAAALYEAVSDALISMASNVERANGISIYFPFRNKVQFMQMRSAYKNVAVSSDYLKFLDLGTASWLKSKWRGWELEPLTDAGDEYTLALTDEQKNNITGAYMTVIAALDTGGYVPYMMRCALEPDRKGVLHIPKTVRMPAVTSETGERMLCPVTEVETDEERTIYRTENTGLESDVTYADHLTDYQTQEIYAVMALDHETDELSVLSFNDNSSGSEPGGKNSVDVSSWEGFYSTQRPVYTTRNEKGVILPVSEWNEIGFGLQSDLPFDQQAGFEMISSEQTGLDLFIQVQIEDVNGEIYGSELAPLPGNSTCYETKIDTAKGTLTFLVYEDHAEAVDYDGTDTELILPSEADGVPVTRICDYAFGKYETYNSVVTYPFETVVLPDTVTQIGSGAFYACSRLTKIRLPEELKRIGSLAFCLCVNLEEIDLPAGCVHIGKCAFAYCDRLREIALPPGLEYFGSGVLMGCKNLTKISYSGSRGCIRVIDGAVYTADGSMLLAYPAASGKELEIAKGTVGIAYGACSSAQFQNAKLPDSLKEIGNYAFYACDSLRMPVLPDGLVSVGMHAFDTQAWSIQSGDLTGSPEKIIIGPDMEWVREHAFDGYLYKQFEVDPENTRFTSGMNALLNGAGDSVISLSLNSRHQVIVPDGATEFEFEMLDFLDNLNRLSDDFTVHLYLPASVIRFPENVSAGDIINLRIHCPKGSLAEEFAISNGIPFTNEMAMAFKIGQEKCESGVLTARIYSDYVMITRYEGEDEILTIPDSISGRPVRVIGDGERPISVNGYDGRQNALDAPFLREIVLPEGVTELNKKALAGFGAASNVTVELNEGLKSIGESALTDCRGFLIPGGIEKLGKRFTNGSFPDGFRVTASLQYIDPEAFSDCSVFPRFYELEAAFGSGVQVESAADPEAEPGADSEAEPGADPEAEPGADPEAEPGADSEAEPGADPEAEPGADSEKEPAEINIQEGAAVSIGAHKETGSIAPEKHYAVQDGVLFTADLKTLVCYPSQGAESYRAPESCEVIGERAFSRCRSIVHVTLPSGLKRIEKNAFLYCSNLQEVSFAASVMEAIGESAFASCEQLTSIQLPGAEEIGNYAFNSCRNLKEIIFAEGIRSIGIGAFEDTAAADLHLPKTLRSVGNYAFSNSMKEARPDSPTKLFIPANLTSIGVQAFAGIGAAAYEVDPNNESYASVNGLLTDKAGNTVIACPAGMTGRAFIPEGAAAIAGYAFYNPNTVTELFVPASIETIGSINFGIARAPDLRGSSSFIYQYTITFICRKNSFAHHYAMEQGIPCILE